jgi:hypothetical protein
MLCTQMLDLVLGADRFDRAPVDVIGLALEYSRKVAPDSPIHEVVERNIPGCVGALVYGEALPRQWAIMYRVGQSDGRRSFTVGHEFAHQAILLEPASAAEAPSSNCIIKGNVNPDGERIYHMPGGLSYAKINMNAPGKRRFCSEEEAKSCWLATGAAVASDHRDAATKAALRKPAKFSSFVTLLSCGTCELDWTENITKPPLWRGTMKYSATRVPSESSHVAIPLNTTSLSTNSLIRADANLPLQALASLPTIVAATSRPFTSGPVGIILTKPFASSDFQAAP